MFNATWILDDAAPAPDPAALRRPGLLAKRHAGKPIHPRWPLSSDVARRLGRYPADVRGLQIESAHAEMLRNCVGGPGEPRWAAALVTLEDPSAVIPISTDPDVLRFVRAFAAGEGNIRVASIELHRVDEGRGRPRGGRIGDCTWLEGDGEALEMDLRRHLEEVYLGADPDWRDRALSRPDDDEPMLWFIAPTRDEVASVKAAAATFGIAVIHTRENIARDESALERTLQQLGTTPAAAVLHEPAGDQRLAWVADQLRAKLGNGVLVERLSDSGHSLRTLVRTLLALRATQPSAPAGVRVPTCNRCQPGIARIAQAEHLRVATEQAQEGERCICAGAGANNLSLRLRLAATLADEEFVLVIGYQPNFDVTVEQTASPPVRHLFQENNPRAAATRASLAVVLPGSKMGHSDSERFLVHLKALGKPIIQADGGQLSDLIRVLFRLAGEKRPELRGS